MNMYNAYHKVYMIDFNNSKWVQSIHDLRKEAEELFVACCSFQQEGLLTIWDLGKLVRAFNCVFDRAGLSEAPPGDALTFTIYRGALHQFRSDFAKNHPELLSILEEKVRNSRSLSSGL